jgi:hypothetical protein
LVDLADIKADLPNWPDDVIDQWLLKLANRGADTGWPPPEPLGVHAWKYLLGGRPLSWWKNVTWKLEDHDLEFDVLSGDSKLIVSDMIGEHVNDLPSRYPVGPGSKTRFLSAMRHLTVHGTLPRAPVVMRLEDGLSVLDGNHRVTALCFCQAISDEILKKGGTAPLKSQRLWMGTHSAGEVPGLDQDSVK